MTNPPDIDPAGACLCDDPTVWCPVHPAPAECPDCGRRHTNYCKEA